MSDNVGLKVPTWFWVVAVLALLWELMGVAAYLSDVSMTDADLAKLPDGQRQLYAMMPSWVTAAYAIAVAATPCESAAMHACIRVPQNQ